MNGKSWLREFPGGPVTRTLCSQCRGPWLDPRSGSQSHASTCMRQRRPGTSKYMNKKKIFFKNEELKVKSLSRVRLFATPRTVDCQAPQSMGFSRHFLLPGIFQTQRLNLGLGHCKPTLPSEPLGGCLNGSLVELESTCQCRTHGFHP